MPSAADLTPEEVAAVLAARARHSAVEDEIPASLAARIDREVATRVDAELAARSGAAPGKKERPGDGRALGIISVIFGVPLMGLRGISDGPEPPSGLHTWTNLLGHLDEELARAVDLLPGALARAPISASRQG